MIEISFSFDISTSDLETGDLEIDNIPEEDAIFLSYTMTTADSSVVGGDISAASANTIFEGAVAQASSGDSNLSGFSVPNGPSNPFYLATINDTNWQLGITSSNAEDVVLYDPLTNTASLYWDGGSSGPNPNVDNSFDIDALHVFPDGTFLISIESNDEVIYGTTVDQGDLLLIDPVAQTSSIYFDGSETFDSSAEDIDGVAVGEDGILYLTTSSGAVLGGVSFGDGDVVSWDGTNANIVFEEDDHFNVGDLDALGSISITPIPEPSGMLLLFGTLLIPICRRHRTAG